MPKPTTDILKSNHGQSVSGFVHELQAARVPGEHPGLGGQVSEFARNKGGGLEPGSLFDIPDELITVIKPDGIKESFESFSEALAWSVDGDTLYVGKGVYTAPVNLDERVTIIGEEGAVIDASGMTATAGVQGTFQLFDGFSGGSIEGVTVVAVEGGNALVSIIGQAVTDVSFTDVTFDGGANTVGSVVYFNPGADGVVLDGVTFEGAALAGSPLLGVEGDNVQVINSTFGLTTGAYAKVEIWAGPNGNTDDVVLTGNAGLGSGDVVLG